MAMNFNTPNNQEPDVMVEMNTTPLIDVMLVLLIMLIITIPAQLHSVNLDMPQPTQAPKKAEPVVIKVEVDARSVVNWNGTALPSRADLEAKIEAAAAMRPQPELHIRANGKAKYAAVAGVLATAQRLGLSKIGIVGSEQFVN